MEFFGRKEILSRMSELWGKRSASLVTCRGRRRIGKSTLIEKFALDSKARFIKIEGLRPDKDTDDRSEREAFAVQLAAQSSAETSCPENWLQAFIRLDKEIANSQKTVVLLDEVSWMAFDCPTFSAMLKVAWDNYLKKHDRLVFVVCGSVSTWIKEHMVDDGAFFGRRSLDVIVPELPLCDCVKFWGKRAGRLATKDIIDVLSVTGGVPRYLEEINPSLSAAENIRAMCFVPKAPLRVDFDEMFGDVITRQPRLAEKVLRSLVDGPLTLTEIADALGIGKGGDISKSLEQLCESGMVADDGGRNPETGSEIRAVRYRLSDNYVRFYLKYIEPEKRTIDQGSYSFTGLEQFRNWSTVMGLQFENLVLANYRALLPHLHLDRTVIKSAAPYCKRGSKKTGRTGFQIDLLLQTEMAMVLVEVKRKTEVGREVIEEVREKMRRLKRPSETSLRLVLVYEGRLDRTIEADGFFDAVVNVRDLLD